MQEIMRFQAVLCEKDRGYGRREKIVIDLETGEVVLSRPEADIEEVFARGANAAETVLVVGRERKENGAIYIVVSDYNREKPKTLGGWWQGLRRRTSKKPKHTGGKPAYLKLMLADLAEVTEKLNEKELGILLKLAKYIDWHTGVLINTKTKTPLTTEELEQILECSRTTLTYRLNNLKRAEVIETDSEGRFIFSRELLQKG